eukprot:4334467-Ditylum_brightwellii.AAC.1
MAALSEQAAGLSPEQSIFFAKTLKNLEYQLITAYGPSKKKNYHSEQHPVHDIGKGPTDGPPKWTCTVNTALRCYDKKAKGALIKDPTGRNSTQQTAKMFVDDNKQMHINRVRSASATQLMSYINHDVNLWDELLWITGGLLEKLKTTYSLMVWDFEPSGRPVITPMSKLQENTVKIRCQGIATMLKKTSEDKAIRNSGVSRALTLQEVTELANLKAKMHTFAYAVSVCSLQQDEIWKGYWTIYILSISYLFPVTSFIEKELKTLDSILLPRLLPKLGYNRNTKRAIVFGPTRNLRNRINTSQRTTFGHAGRSDCKTYKVWR